MSLLAPNEILSNNPGVAKRWKAHDIGYLLRLGLVRGKKLLRSCKVEEKDVLKLFSSAYKNESNGVT